MTLLYRRSKPLNRCLVQHIEGCGFGLSTSRLNLVRNVAQSRLVASRQDNRRLHRRQPFANRRANPACRAGNHRNLSGKIPHFISSLNRRRSQAPLPHKMIHRARKDSAWSAWASTNSSSNGTQLVSKKSKRVDIMDTVLNDACHNEPRLSIIRPLSFQSLISIVFAERFKRFDADRACPSRLALVQFQFSKDFLRSVE
jgi:hypothetical protein